MKKVHYDWLRENLLELKIDSNHIHNENLREFTVETLLKNGFIYKYSPIAENCLSPVKIDDYVTRDFSADILVKDTCDRFFNDPENICELRDFAAETLEKNGTVANLADAVFTDRDEILKTLEKISVLRDFAAETLQKNCIKSNSRVDTLISAITGPENRAIFEQKFHETIKNFRFVAFLTSFLRKNFHFFKSKFKKNLSDLTNFGLGLCIRTFIKIWEAEVIDFL